MTTTRVRWRALVLVTVVALTLIAAVAAAVGMWAWSRPHHRATAAEPLHPDSSFRTRIPADARVDPARPAVTAHLADEGRAYASLVEFGIPVYTADAGAPRYRVPCLPTTWGPCPFDGVDTPIPDGARPHTGSDGAMVVVDEAAQLSYEF